MRVGAAVTFNVTGTTSGLFAAPAEVMVTEPMSVPADRPVVLIETVRFWGVLPDVGVTCNHPADDATEMFAAAVAEIASTWDGGADPRSWWLNVSDVGLALSVAVAG